jgi:hypothetical protein
MRELDRAIGPLHHLGCFRGDTTVFLRGFGLHLPGTIHLVAEAPELDTVRLFPAMRATPIRQLGSTGMVAVFDQRAGRVPAAGAKVHRQHWLDIPGTAPVDEFVRAELIRLG